MRIVLQTYSKKILLQLGRWNLSSLRFYSNSKKFQSLDELNKRKKPYVFGIEDSSIDNGNNINDNKMSGQMNSNDIHERFSRLQNTDIRDVNYEIENDPRLSKLEPGSADFRHQRMLIHKEFQEKEQRDSGKYERLERLKGVGIGIGVIVSVVFVHQVIINYEEIRSSILHRFRFDLDDSKIGDIKDRTTSIVHRLSKMLSSQVDKSFIQDLQPSNGVSGIYIFGDGHPIPRRLKEFDGMLFRYVEISDDCIVAVNEKGAVYTIVNDVVEKLDLPKNTLKCTISGSFIYFLTKKGEILFTPRPNIIIPDFKPERIRNWLGSSSEALYGKLTLESPAKDFSSGDSHMLILTKQRSVNVVKTGDNYPYYGELGLPNLDVNDAQIPVNKPFDLKLLNYEVVDDGNTKSLLPRSIIGIACGKSHNLVLDDHNNIWSWGNNIYGQCGYDVSYKTDVQRFPKICYRQGDLEHNLQGYFKDPSVNIRHISASDATSYLQLQISSSENNVAEELVSFGSGANGQLGINRYIQVSSLPQMLKGLSNLTEYDEKKDKIENIGIRNLSVGANHVFITLDNQGNEKDVLAFGDNMKGQLGNGKFVKIGKPSSIPRLIEPEDVEGVESNLSKRLARQINDPVNNRLQLSKELKLQNGRNAEQVIVAGGNRSVIYYRKA